MFITEQDAREMLKECEAIESMDISVFASRHIRFLMNVLRESGVIAQ